MRAWAGAGTARRSRAGCIQVGRSGGLTRCGLGTEPDPRLSYQARTWLIWSRTGRVRVGRSGSKHAPHAADLLERRKSGAGQAESGSDDAGAHKHHRWPRPEPDPRLSYQARTWLIRSRTGLSESDRSGSQQAPHAADLGRSRTHKLWLFRSRTGPTGQVRVGWSGSPTRCEPGQEPSPTGPEPIDQRYSSVAWARDAKARTALMRQEATSKDLGLRLCLALSHGLYPMCSDSDGF